MEPKFKIEQHNKNGKNNEEILSPEDSLEFENLNLIKNSLDEINQLKENYDYILSDKISKLDNISLTLDQQQRISAILDLGKVRAQQLIESAKIKISAFYNQINKARVGIALGTALAASTPSMNAQEVNQTYSDTQKTEMVSDNIYSENQENSIDVESLKAETLKTLNDQLEEIRQSLLITKSSEEDYVTSIQARDIAEKRAYILSEDFQTGESVDLDNMEMFHLRSLENSKNTDLEKFLSTAHAIQIDFENGLGFSEGSFVSEGIGKAYGISFPEIPSLEEAQDAQVREAFISELKEIISQAREADLKQTEYIKNNPDEFIFTDSAEEWAHLRWKSAQENKEKDVQKFNELSSKIKNIETMSPQDFFEYTKRLDTQQQN